MKILTLTTQYANNMGALLQCYALSRFLNKQEGVVCQVIQYFPKGYDKSWKTIRTPHTIKDAILLLYSFIRIDQILLFKKKKVVMKSFMHDYLPLTKETYYVGDLQRFPPIADAIIVGSDQVWNFRLRKDFSYFLDFIGSQPNCRKIAYAPSISEPWSEAEEQEVKPLLEKFFAISIRENANLTQVRRVSPHNNPTVVLDPVFLLDRSEWDSIKRSPKINGSYILCYFLSAPDLAVKVVKRVKELTGLPIVHLNVNVRDKFNSDTIIKVADPCDFVGLISGATYVVTNSFHCSAFSLIYRKNLVYVPKETRNNRIEGLRELFQTSDFFVGKDKLNILTKADLETDYSKSDESGSIMINYSKQFLLNAINK